MELEIWPFYKKKKKNLTKLIEIGLNLVAACVCNLGGVLKCELMIINLVNG